MKEIELTKDQIYRHKKARKFLRYGFKKGVNRCKDCRYVSFETVVNRKDKEGEPLPDKRINFHCNVMDGLDMPVDKMGSCKDFEYK